MALTVLSVAAPPAGVMAWLAAAYMIKAGLYRRAAGTVMAAATLGLFLALVING